MESLYNISERFLELFNRDDLTEEEFKEYGEELALILKNKAENIVGYNFTLESNKNILKQEIERLKNILDSIDNKQDKLKQHVKENMEKLNLLKIETAIGNIKIVKNKPSVNIINSEIIDEKYKLTKTIIETSICKNEIAKDIKAGIEVNGAKLVEGIRLEIK